MHSIFCSCRYTLKRLNFHMEQRRQRICQQRAQESAEQCQRLCDSKRREMKSTEEAEQRAAHRGAQRRYRQALLARETTEQTQQRLETDRRRMRQVRAETNEVRRLKT